MISTVSSSPVGPTDPVVWVIVVSYNGGTWLQKCLESLTESTLPVRVVVLDNGSTDGSVALIKNNFPRVTLIQNIHNAGFGPANNQGIQLALTNQAEYVFLLNQDAWIEPDTLDKLIRVSRQHPEFGIISPVHLNADGSALDHGFANYLRADKCQGFISDLYTGHLKVLYSLPFVNAAAWLLTKNCLLTVGGFNPIFFMYGEDVEFCHRVVFHGFRIGVVPRAHIYHARSNAGDNKVGSKKPMSRGEQIKQQAVDLAALLNINRPFALQLATFAGQSAFSFLTHGWQQLPGLLRAKWTVLTKLPAVVRSRSLCKRRGRWFLG